MEIPTDQTDSQPRSLENINIDTSVGTVQRVGRWRSLLHLSHVDVGIAPNFN